MGKKLTQNDWEAILMNRVYGISNAKSAEKLGLGNNTVNSVINAFDAVKDEDWSKCCNLIVTYNMTLDVFQWAAQKTGKSIPPIISQSYEKYQEDKRKKNLASVKAKEDAEKPAPENGGDDLKIMLSQMIAAQRKTNELLESLLDVVIPKYVIDLKDNINVNCDVLNQTAKASDEKLEAIKLAFRKKGL